MPGPRGLQHVVAQAELESLDALAAQLTRPAFGHTEDLSDLLQGDALHVVQRDRNAFLLGEA